MSKMKNARAKRAKMLFFTVKYANFWVFCCRTALSWLLKLPIAINLRSGVPFVFVGAGKERLIQLLDYPSAAP